MRSTIICVDDEKMLLNILAEQLGQWFGANYNIEKAISGDDALEILEECIDNDTPVSVVISDYIMPNMKGDELLAKINQKDSRIRKIMLTGYSSIEGIISALNNGGLYRYLTKPWDTKDLMLTILEAIKSYENEKRNLELSKKYEMLYHKNEKLYRDYEASFNMAIQAFVSAIDLRSPLRAGQAKTVAQYSVMLGKVSRMAEEDLKYLEYMALLHDVGIVGMKEADLIKLDNEGLNISNASIIEKTKAAESIIANMNDANRLLKGIKYQYERYDGNGVFKLVGEEIPIEARILGLVNYFTALKAELAKNDRFNLTTIITALEGTKNTFYSPALVDLFVKLLSVKAV